MGVPLLELTEQYKIYKDELESEVQEVLQSGRYIYGPKLQQFEENLAEYCGAEYAVGVNSGTDALILSLRALGVGEGDEVITSPFTFFATSESISEVGATPVFVDINDTDFNIDTSKIEEKITARTKALLPVHLFGQCVDMGALNTIAEKHGLSVLEDACQAIGAEYNGKRAGNLGHAAAFSFFPSKNLGAAGDGGIVTTNSKEIYNKIMMLRVHGSNTRYYHKTLGYNSRLDAIQAAILNVKLKHLSKFNEQRQNHAKYYSEKFADLENVETPYIYEGRTHIFHQYTLKVDNRDELKKHLDANNIGNSIYYPVPLHLQEAHKSLGYKESDLPVTETMADKVISLPIYPELKQEQLDEVVEVITKFYQG